MHYIHMFLASSIIELEHDRDALTEFVQEMNDILIDHDIYIELFRCEFADAAIQDNGMQNRYNQEITKPCDIFINLYYRKAGIYTINEFECALDTQRSAGRPLIITGFRDFSPTSTGPADVQDENETLYRDLISFRKRISSM